MRIIKKTNMAVSWKDPEHTVWSWNMPELFKSDEQMKQDELNMNDFDTPVDKKVEVLKTNFKLNDFFIP